MAGQVWEESSAGGFLYSGELSTVLRNALQPLTRFVQHCDADDFTDKGLHVGDAFQWNSFSDVGAQGTRLSETQRMPETSIVITQMSGTISEFGNSVPYSGYLDDLSAQPLRQIINKALKNDTVKAFEFEAHAQFALSPLTVTPDGGTSATAINFETTGTPTDTNDLAMNNEHVKLISDQMKERNINTYSDGDYRCVGRPTTFRGLKDDLEPIAQHTAQGYGHIMNGEVGRSYEGIKFYEQTSIPSQAWTNGKSDEAFFFGDDTVMEAIVCPPEIRGKLPGDYGRDKGVAWYGEEGFALVHTSADQARIVRWATAA
jgi:hypothetical protein